MKMSLEIYNVKCEITIPENLQDKKTRNKYTRYTREY